MKDLLFAQATLVWARSMIAPLNLTLSTGAKYVYLGYLACWVDT